TRTENSSRSRQLGRRHRVGRWRNPGWLGGEGRSVRPFYGRARARPGSLAALAANVAWTRPPRARIWAIIGATGKTELEMERLQGLPPDEPLEVWSHVPPNPEALGALCQ